MNANMTKTKRVKFTYEMALLFIAVIMFITIGLIRNTFFSSAYIIETVKQIVEIGIMVLPATLIIISGGIDFSMSSVLVFSSIIASIVSRNTNSFVAILVALIIGVASGLLNGFLIAKLKLPPLVTTLATMYLFKGIAEGVTMGIPSVGASVSSFPAATFMGTGTILGLPTQVGILIVLAVTFYLLLSKTCFGRYVYAIGLNDAAAEFAGIRVERMKILLYVIGGITYAIASLVFLGRFSSIRYDSADPLTLQIITVVILGGTNIAGGSGTISGSMLAVAIIGILKSGMNVLFIPQTQQKIILGLILLAALMIFQILRNKSGKQKPIVASTKKMQNYTQN